MYVLFVLYDSTVVVCLSQETDTSHFSADTEHVTYDLYCNMVNKEGDVEEEHIFA